jgi:hypothetical protein
MLTFQILQISEKSKIFSLLHTKLQTLNFFRFSQKHKNLGLMLWNSNFSLILNKLIDWLKWTKFFFKLINQSKLIDQLFNQLICIEKVAIYIRKTQKSDSAQKYSKQCLS